LASVMEYVCGTTWFLDYRRCSVFTANSSSSLWGMRGKTINTVCATTQGKQVQFHLMFDYGITSDFITPSDIQTMSNHINILRTNRIKAINDLKNTATSAAGEYDSALASVANLNLPVTSMDSSIKKANEEKVIFDSDAIVQGENLTRLEKSIVDLNSRLNAANEAKSLAETAKTNAATKIDQQAQILADLSAKLAAATNDRSSAEAAKELASKNSSLKDDEIKTLTASKLADTTKREKMKQIATEAANKAKEKFAISTTGIKKVCPSCAPPVQKAELSFGASPFKQEPVVTNIKSVFTTG